MLRYSECRELIKRGRHSQKKLANNTYLEELDDGSFGVKLHETFVVKIHPNGEYTLDSGGWKTVTTKDRINRYSPVRVYQQNSIWYLEDGSLFEDGCIVTADGVMFGSKDKPEEVERKKKLLDRRVRKYINGFADSVSGKGLDTPDPGDCWDCYLQAKSVANGKVPSLKERDPMGFDHLLSHMEENYYVPSLLWKAIQDRGYRDPGFIWHMIDVNAKKGETGMLKDVLRGYFRKRKGELVKLV